MAGADLHFVPMCCRPRRRAGLFPTWFSRCAAWLAIALLSACAALKPAPVVDPARVQAFDLSGRVNVRVEGKAYPGRIRWQHRPDTDDVWLYSPIGSGMGRLHQDPNGASVVTADGKEHRARDLRRLAREQLGWDLPLAGLQYWVRGLEWPALGAGQQERGDDGRLTSLTQGSWQVSYLDWTPAGATGLPSKLDLAGEGLRMRLVIDEWKVDDLRP